MKSITKITSTVALALTLFSQSSMACSYSVNQTQKKNELIAAGITNLNISLEVVKSVSVVNFHFYESIPTPMCPKEVTYEGVIFYDYMDPTAMRPTQCQVTLNVTKKEDWITHVDRFLVNNPEPACTVLPMVK